MRIVLPNKLTLMDLQRDEYKDQRSEDLHSPHRGLKEKVCGLPVLSDKVEVSVIDERPHQR